MSIRPRDLNVSTIAADSNFGPQLQAQFDFTLLFEHSILTILPACLLLIASPVYVYQLVQKPLCVRKGLLLCAKLVVAVLLLSLELASAILWSLNDDFRSGTSLAAASLSCITAFGIAVVLYAEHRRSLRSSAFLSIYLSLTMLFDIAKSRSYFTRPGMTALGALAIVIAVSKLVLLLLEECSKRSLIQSTRFRSSMGPETTSGFWNRSFFLWLNATLLTGFKDRMSVDDLHDMGPEFDSEHLLAQFQVKWPSANKGSTDCLAKTCFRTLVKPFCAIVVPRLCFTGFKFAQPLLLRRIVQAIGQETLSEDVSGGLIGATVLVYFGMMITKAYYKHLFYRFMTMLRGQLVSAIFDKTLRLDAVDVKKSAAVTLMSTDIEGIERGLTVLHDMWAGVIELGLAIFLLGTLIGGASFLVVVPAVASTVVSVAVAKRMGPARMAWNQSIQARVATTSNILAQLKGIKMTGLAPTVANSLQNLRVAEVQKSKQLRILSIVMYAITCFSSSITPVIVMAGGMFWTISSGRLTAAEAFATLSIVALVLSPLQVLLNAFPQFTSVRTCFSRIQTFLLLDDRIDGRVVAHASRDPFSFDLVPGQKATAKASASDIELSNIQQEAKDTSNRPVIRLEKASIAVTCHADPILKDLNLVIEGGSLTMVIGPIGSGKTMLLRSFLGETTVVDGILHVEQGDIAYCDQTSWLRNVSIRNNILGQTAFDPEWYNKVLHSCLLHEDLNDIPGGDEATVGSGGVNVSGGQRQRIALARAIYSRKRILILDDVFSGLDHRTARAIFHNLFDTYGIVRESRTTVIMATHQLDHIGMADRVIALDGKGNASEQNAKDSHRKDIDSNTECHSLLGLSAEKDQDSSDTEATAKDIISPGGFKQGQLTTVTKKVKQEELMKRQRGDMRLYSFYLKSIGALTFVAWISLVALAAVWEKMPSVFMRLWLDNDPNNDTWFAGFATLGGTSFLCSVIMLTLFMMKVVPSSAESLHWMLVDRVINAKLSFLSNTDMGSLLNRFSQDMTLVNQVLPAAVSQFFIYLFAVLVDLAIIASGAKYAAAITPFFVVALYILQYFYLRTSRQIRHLDLEVKAPLYTQFTETALGIQHIRAFGWTSQVMDQSLQLLNHSQKPYYYMFCIQRWLTLVLDIFVMITAVVLVTVALKYPHTTTQSAIGLALLNVMAFSESLTLLINSWIQLETSLGAVARLKTFLAETPFERDPQEGCLPRPDGWPQQGKIEIQDVTARYHHDQESRPVLRDVSVVIESGQKVGIIGRTGSGKSSLILTLLRLLEYDGTILIDGIDTSSITRQQLRSCITTLPQDAIEFDGSVRDNLNPFKLPEASAHAGVPTDDNVMTEVLTRVGLWQHITTRGGLDASLSSIGLSHGQKQLLCLARAILHNIRTGSRIVLVDEATSNVDHDTDERMQAVMSEAFAECTVLTIAHRLETLKNVDVVLELDSGRLVASRSESPIAVAHDTQTTGT